MIQGPECAALFWYVHRPLVQCGDGGFSVTVYENDILCFRIFDSMRQVVQELNFALPSQVREQLWEMIDGVACWRNTMPQNLRCSHPPSCASMLGLAGHPMYVVEELEETAFLPFATQRGHFARQIFLFVEDVSEMLYHCGFRLELQRFNWDQENIFPIPSY